MWMGIAAALYMCRWGVERMGAADTGIPLAQPVQEKPIWVWADRSNATDAQLRLEHIHGQMQRVVQYLLEHRIPTDDRAELLSSRFAQLTLRELNPGHDTIGYTYWKHTMDVCLRNPENVEAFDDDNNAMFVALHELAHVMSDDMGHDTQFWDNFRHILMAAIHLHIYTPVLYDATPQRHCGYLIKSTPIRDVLRQ